MPEGFCVTTVGYEQVIGKNGAFQTLLNQLAMLKIEERDRIGEISKQIREVIMAVEIPVDVVESVAHYLSHFGDEHAYAVRSSATAEDLPYASFRSTRYVFKCYWKNILQHIKIFGLLCLQIGRLYTECKTVLIIIKFLYVLSFKNGFPEASGILLLRIRLLRIGRCCQSMPLWTWRGASIWIGFCR